MRLLSSFAQACVGVGLGLFAGPLAAQESPPPMVSATDMETVASTLRAAGYDIKVVQRVEGENSAYIEVETGTGLSSIIFSDCNDAVPDFCETLILSTWWGRKSPISDEAVAAANYNNKYVSVFRRGDGNPGMQWALLTRREGIPATVFLNALQRFSGIARDFRDAAYANDGSEAGESASQDATESAGEAESGEAESGEAGSDRAGNASTSVAQNQEQ